MIAHDTAATESAMTYVAQNIAAILPYLQAMQSLTLGAQPLVVDGNVVANWDPLSGTPAIESALNAAQIHAGDLYFTTVLGLREFPNVLAKATGSVGASGIVNDLATIGRVQGELPPGAVPTAAQRQTVNAALADINQQLNGLLQFLSEIQGGAQKFLGGVSSDLQTLSNGSESVATAIAQLQQNNENAVLQYSGLGGSGIINILSAITSQMNGDLTAIQAAIAQAMSAQDAVVPALGRLQDLFTGLGSDYHSVALQVTKASDAEFGSIMQQIDTSILQKYWQDASAFATAHGLGAPPL